MSAQSGESGRHAFCQECRNLFKAKGRRGPLPKRCEKCRDRHKSRQVPARPQGRDPASQRQYDQETRPLQYVLDWALTRKFLKHKLRVADLRRTPGFMRVRRVVVKAYQDSPQGQRCQAGWTVLVAEWGDELPTT
ncbi:MAG: hypothetical protein AAGA48_30510 [Myxococcota bacterium]